MEMKILLASPSPEALAPFTEALSAEKDVKLQRVANAREALETATSSKPDMVVLDERIKDMKLLEVIKRLLQVDPFINVACISTLSSDEFHEYFEGLGVLAQLTSHAGPKEAEGLLARLAAIKNQVAGV
jgi:DNA-binding NarL/FixJ family response regulator